MHLQVDLLIHFLILFHYFNLTSAFLTKTRVIGGQKVSRNQFPYQISIQVNKLHRCGGGIIDQIWIVTAAHCYYSNLWEVSALAGVYDFSIENMNGQRRKVVLFYKHEDYKGGVGADDIALVKVDKIFEFNNAVKAIKLPVDNAYPIGKGLLTGWGSITDTRQPEYPTVLHSTFLPIHSQKKCLSLWKMPSMMDKTLCAGSLDGSHLTCSGDSGSPLVQPINGQLLLIGIVSGGACGIQNKPSIFVRVSYYKDWITSALYRHQRQRV